MHWLFQTICLLLNSLPQFHSKQMASTPIFPKTKPTYVTSTSWLTLKLLCTLVSSQEAEVPLFLPRQLLLLCSWSQTLLPLQSLSSEPLLHFQILSLSWTFLSIYIFRFPPAHSILLLLSPLGLLVKIKCILRQKSKGASLLTLLKEELIYFLLPLPHHLLMWTLALWSVPPLSNEITCSKVISILPSTKFIAFSQLLSSWTSL